MEDSVSDEIERATGRRPDDPNRPFAGANKRALKRLLGIGGPNDRGLMTRDYSTKIGVTQQAVRKWARFPSSISDERAAQILDVYADDGGRSVRFKGLRGLFMSDREAAFRASIDWERADEIRQFCLDAIENLSDGDLLIAARVIESLVRTGDDADEKDADCVKEGFRRLLHHDDGKPNGFHIEGC